MTAWRGVWIAVGCVALTLFFSVLQFPWERFRPFVQDSLARATGADVQMADLGMGLSLAGPTVKLAGLELRWPGEAPLRVDRAEAGLAYSFSWLRARPALAIDAELGGGELDGTVWPLGEMGFDGAFEDLGTETLANLPFGAEELPVEGLLSGDIDVRREAEGWRGSVAVEGLDGNLLLPGLPIALPFDDLQLVLDLEDDGSIRVRRAQLEGPMASFDATGTIGASASLVSAPLEIDVELSSVSPALQTPLQRQGIPLDAGGGARFSLGGTASRPTFR